MMLLAKDSMYLTKGGYRAIPESGEYASDNTRNDALKAKALTFKVVTHRPDSHVHDGKLLVAYLGCVYSSGTVDVTANRITISNAVFRATHRMGTFNINDNVPTKLASTQAANAATFIT